MRIAYRFFPEGLLTGTPNQNITDSSKPPKTKEKASQKSFNTFDLEKLHSQLDRELSDRSVGSMSLLSYLLLIIIIHYQLLIIVSSYLPLTNSVGFQWTP